MNHHIVPLFVAVALLANACLAASVNRQNRIKNKDINRQILEEISKGFDSNVIQKHKALSHGLVAITYAPNRTYSHTPGTLLPLSCEGIGSPAPTMRWFRNNKPVYEFDLESNEVLDSNPSSLARINSTLLVKHTESLDEYTCVLVSGLKTARASTIVYRKDGGVTDLPDRTRLLPFEPHIVVSYKVYMDTIGTDVVLPCKAKGHPKPNIIWNNNRGQHIQKDSRMNILKSGELVIHGLRWSDMGEYSCTATNSHGSTTVNTFVYPAKAANSGINFST